MKKSEILKLRSKFSEGRVLSAQELNDFIDHEMVFSNPENRKFAIFDLTRQNVLYQLNADLFKISSRKFFRFEIPSELGSIILDISQKYPDVKLCTWETAGLNSLLEMQLMKNLIFVEVEKGFESLILGQLNQFDRFSVLWKTDISTLDAYMSNKPVIMIKTLTYKAPVNKKRFSDRMGYNLHYAGNLNSVSTPKIEKVIVDLFTDPILQFIDGSQKDMLIRNTLTEYVVNFKTLLSYARNRNKKEEMISYFQNKIRFDLSTGEFNDQQP